MKRVENGQPVAQIARYLGIGENLIYQWTKQGKQPPAGQEKNDHSRKLPEEIEHLKEKLRQSEREKEILDQQTCVSIGF